MGLKIRLLCSLGILLCFIAMMVITIHVTFTKGLWSVTVATIYIIYVDVRVIQNGIGWLAKMVKRGEE